jgi:hypothetical protein
MTAAKICYEIKLFIKTGCNEFYYIREIVMHYLWNGHLITCILARAWFNSLFLRPGRYFFSFVILYTLARTSWTGDQLVASPLPAHRTSQAQNKRTQTSMPRVGFEPDPSVRSGEDSLWLWPRRHYDRLICVTHHMSPWWKNRDASAFIPLPTILIAREDFIAFASGYITLHWQGIFSSMK